MDEILTAEQVAHILQVHPFTVLKFIKKGKLKASKLGRVYRIRRSDVDKFLDSQIEQAEPESKPAKHPAKASTTKEAKTRNKKTIKNKPEKEEEQQVTDIPNEEISETKQDAEPVIVIEEVKPEEKETRNNSSDIDHYVIELKNK